MSASSLASALSEVMTRSTRDLVTLDPKTGYWQRHPWQEVHARAENVAARVDGQSRIGLVGEPTVEFLAGIYGAILAGASDEVVATLGDFGREIGIAYQIVDDLLGVFGLESETGKTTIGDLREGKRTVMMIHLFRHASPRLRARMARINAMPRERKSQAHAEEMLAAMQQLGSIDHAIGVADKLAHRGVRHFERDLDFIGNNEAKAVLRQIAHYVTTRSL